MDTLKDALDVLWFIVWTLAMLALVVIATPFILLWPRRDKTQSYVRTVARRYGRLLRHSPTPDDFGEIEPPHER